MNDYIHIGKIAAPHGVDGTLIVEHALGKRVNFKDVEVLFIEKAKDSFIPYFITKAVGKTTELTHVQVEQIGTREKANILTGKKVWLLQVDFHKVVGKQAPIGLMGYAIVEKGQSLGVIKEVIEQPHQLLVTIVIKEQEVYIPLHEESLLGVDHAKKIVEVNLPEGLLDVYFES
jgi:16S rRNA processing protein RimM